jgi:hypothetical protein
MRPSGFFPLGLLSQLVPCIDMLGRACNGMWFLLDATTFVDALRIEGLQLWGPAMQHFITVEAHRFWLLALVYGVVSGLLKLSISTVGAREYNFFEDASAEPANNHACDDKAESVVSSTGQAKSSQALWRSCVANAIDIIIPGYAIGWIKVEPGIVGIAMFVTSVLTSMDVWDRCVVDIVAAS